MVSIEYTLFAATVIVFGMAAFIVFFLFAHQKRLLKHTQEKEKMRGEYEQELLRSQLEIQESTLAHVGREIHDNIGQILSVAKLYLSSLKPHAEANQQKKQTEALELVGKAIVDLRALSKSLNPDSVQLTGFEQSLEKEINRLAHSGVFKVTYKSNGPIVDFNTDTDVMLFRMCQEILSNAIRHSKATEINVKLEWKQEVLSIQIEDDGKGFSPEELSNPGQGLFNLRKRAEMIGADLKLKSEINTGTLATISLPIQLSNTKPKIA